MKLRASGRAHLHVEISVRLQKALKMRAAELGLPMCTLLEVIIEESILRKVSDEKNKAKCA